MAVGGPNNKRYMPIAGAFAESADFDCCDNAARSWSGGINIYMIGAGCAECICAGEGHSQAAGDSLRSGESRAVDAGCSKGTPRGLQGRLQAIISAVNTSRCLLSVPAMIVRKFGDSMARAKPAQMIFIAA